MYWQICNIVADFRQSTFGFNPHVSAGCHYCSDTMERQEDKAQQWILHSQGMDEISNIHNSIIKFDHKKAANYHFDLQIKWSNIF